ncbi:MAG TPA: hypothetical protein DHV42_07230 [Lachnospiraceae bacterium]|nr:hypothetical protein [Lachnospiraceae bacterium]
MNLLFLAWNLPGNKDLLQNNLYILRQLRNLIRHRPSFPSGCRIPPTWLLRICSFVVSEQIHRIC